MGFKEMQCEILVLAGVLLLISSAALAEAPQENQIHVEVAGLRNDKGHAVCSLFSSAGDFPKKIEKAVAHSTAVIVRRSTAVLPRPNHSRSTAVRAMAATTVRSTNCSGSSTGHSDASDDAADSIRNGWL